jgi:hypothetical protein
VRTLDLILATCEGIVRAFEFREGEEEWKVNAARVRATSDQWFERSILAENDNSNRPTRPIKVAKTG